MKSWEAMKKAVNGKTGLMSSACIERGWTLESPTLYKYQEQYGGTFSGAANCIDRTSRIIQASRSIGNPYEAWSAPLHALCHEHGHIAVRLPEHNPEMKGEQQGLLRTIKEYSDLVQASSEAMEKDGISRKEAERIVAEGREAAQQTMAYVAQIEARYLKTAPRK